MIKLDLRYCTKLFKRSTAQKLAERCVEVLEQVVDNPMIQLKDIDIKHDILAAKSAQLEEVEFGF